MSRVRPALQLLGPIAVVIVVALIGSTVSESREIDYINALLQTTMVVAIYIFVGNSGVISFGHISFVAVGAFIAGLMTVPELVKPTLLPELFPVLADNTVSPFVSLLLAAGVGGLFALIVGAPLMRLSGLAAGIATFAVLEITHNLLRYWEKIGPGAKTLSLVPVTTHVREAALGAIVAIVVAFLYQRSRGGRLLRASREDPAAAQAAGVRIHSQRLVAFVISGAVAGLAGGLLVHALGSITTEQVYLQLTFITLAMLVVGGMNSLWGAVVGALVVSFLDTYLSRAEDGMELGPLDVNLPDGISIVILGIIMLVILILRPSGLTGGREFGIPSPRRRRGGAPPPAEPGDPMAAPATQTPA
ncbi:MAG TPA: branched-chain amino acid ABC transporter permease [Capillimicrobium sp.]|jgi:branched-chain amino acid transport system permease protein